MDLERWNSRPLCALNVIHCDLSDLYFDVKPAGSWLYRNKPPLYASAASVHELAETAETRCLSSRSRPTWRAAASRRTSWGSWAPVLPPRWENRRRWEHLGTGESRSGPVPSSSVWFGFVSVFGFWTGVFPLLSVTGRCCLNEIIVKPNLMIQDII